ncbi:MULTISPECIES: hypothetical protein [unclassified Bradyrhizobium]|uniref:hypothetical protein n=1 Tax=unclassified Bradyrhizobium TaxID=2631580 RepID=UPI001FF73F35|nr:MULTISPECIES: hypothetical protein [unclassified Bradyrhizobium]
MASRVENVNSGLLRRGELATIADIQSCAAKARKQSWFMPVLAGISEMSTILTPNSCVRFWVSGSFPRSAEPRTTSRDLAGRRESSTIGRNKNCHRRREASNNRSLRFEDIHVDIWCCEADIQRSDDIVATLQTELTQRPHHQPGSHTVSCQRDSAGRPTFAQRYEECKSVRRQLAMSRLISKETSPER